MPKRLTKTNPERLKRDLEIVALRLEGKSLREIGQEIGLCHSRIKAILEGKRIKPIVDEYEKEIRRESEERFQRILESYRDGSIWRRDN